MRTAGRGGHDFKWIHGATVMALTYWLNRKRKWKGIDPDLTPYRETTPVINQLGERLPDLSTEDLRNAAVRLRAQAREGSSLDELLPESFAITREVAHRVLRMRPYDVQIMAGIALHHRKLIEMQTGEGKTLAAFRRTYSWVKRRGVGEAGSAARTERHSLPSH